LYAFTAGALDGGDVVDEMRKMRAWFEGINGGWPLGPRDAILPSYRRNNSQYSHEIFSWGKVESPIFYIDSEKLL
jgi:hypothetical protein